MFMKCSKRWPSPKKGFGVVRIRVRIASPLFDMVNQQNQCGPHRSGTGAHPDHVPTVTSDVDACLRMLTFVYAAREGEA
jgi:hypothetical protein